MTRKQIQRCAELLCCSSLSLSHYVMAALISYESYVIYFEFSGIQLVSDLAYLALSSLISFDDVLFHLVLATSKLRI